MPFVGLAFLFSRRRERLAGAASGPDGFIVRPSRKPERAGPSSDAREEMMLSVSFKVIRVHFLYASFIDIARRDMPHENQIPEPFSGVRLEFIVIYAFSHSPVLFFLSPRHRKTVSNGASRSDNENPTPEVSGL